MKSVRLSVLGLSVILMMTAAAPSVFAQAADVRWDIVHLTPAAPSGATVNPGGQASALDAANDTITLTGTGTFLAPAGGDGTSSAVTGGGTWSVTTSAGVVIGSGTYVVTGLVRWEEAPGTFPATVDNISNPANFRSGLVVLRIEYSDGSHGTLVVSCRGAGAAASQFEGITASKGFVDYWNRVAPSGTPAGANANRTAFHAAK
jgi:hypothetical protein